MDFPPKAAADPLEPTPERLSIAHLFLWTTMSAALLGFDRALGLWGPRDSSREIFGQVMAFCYAPLFGAGATAVVLAIWRRLRGGPSFPRQPGHWLLMVSGLSSITSLCLRALFAAVTTERWWPVDFLVVRFFALFVGLVVLVTAARSVSGYWRVPFWIGVGSALLSLLGSVFFVVDEFWLVRNFDTFLYALLTVCVLTCCAIDLAKHTPRDYLHWAGIGVRVIYTLLTIATPFLVTWLRTSSE